MYDSEQLNLAQMVVGWLNVKWTVNWFCVYLTELRWYAVDLSRPVEWHYWLCYRS